MRPSRPLPTSVPTRPGLPSMLRAGATALGLSLILAACGGGGGGGGGFPFLPVNPPANGGDGGNPPVNPPPAQTAKACAELAGMTLAASQISLPTQAEMHAARAGKWSPGRGLGTHDALCSMLCRT